MSEGMKRGMIRKLWPSEWELLRDHLLRLDQRSRHLRFAHAVGDSFIESYSARMSEDGSTVYAFIENGEVRAAAELKKIGETWGREAEAAFSVEADYQEQGIGSELMGRLIRSARNRGVHLLYMSCLADNAKMQAIARKYEADLHVEYGEVVGEIVPEEANYFSLLAEAMEDRVGYMMTVLSLRRRSRAAA